MRKIKVTIEEHISQTFEIEADTVEEAMQIAEDKYYNREFVLENSCVTAKLMSAADGNGDCTEWMEF